MTDRERLKRAREAWNQYQKAINWATWHGGAQVDVAAAQALNDLAKALGVRGGYIEGGYPEPEGDAEREWAHARPTDTQTAPRALGGSEAARWSVWPRTMRKAWCGEFHQCDHKSDRLKHIRPSHSCAPWPEVPPSCGVCRWWNPQSEECRRRAPRVVEVQS